MKYAHSEYSTARKREGEERERERRREVTEVTFDQLPRIESLITWLSLTFL